MALAAYFYRYPASRGISRAVPKVSDSSTGGTATIKDAIFSVTLAWNAVKPVTLRRG
jgi:hypothetical protein